MRKIIDTPEPTVWEAFNEPVVEITEDHAKNIGLNEYEGHSLYDLINGNKTDINIDMVTGDNHLTAFSIASEIGLIEKDEDVATGEEIEKLPDEELERIVLKTAHPTEAYFRRWPLFLSWFSSPQFGFSHFLSSFPDPLL